MSATLPAFVEQLLTAAAYPHPVAAPIQLLQTHISYVFLTGDYAYKVKKPVDFGFLNFTTLDKRRFYCQEELRLNRRLAPQLYLEVVPILQRGDRYYIGIGANEAIAADTPIVDYAIRMRQFDQSQLFSHLFAANELSPSLIESLGKELAYFHTTATTTPEITSFGSPSAIAQVINNCHTLAEQFIDRCQPRSQYDAIQAFTNQFLATHQDWFVERQAAGKIRECHGDLHLNNICVYNGQVQIFDCIEFNQEFRNIDGIYDVAFLMMDLEFRGRSDLANLFLNTYLEWSSDYEGARLLPLYLCVRAYIRGNVNSLALNDPAISDSEKAQIQATAAAYYEAAYHYTQPRTPKLYVMSGLSGAGKSTRGRRLAQQENAIQIRSDAVRKHLAGIPLDRHSRDFPDVDLYSQAMTQKTYDQLLAYAELLLKQGHTVILDAKYDRCDLRRPVIELAERLGVPLEIHYCSAPPQVLSRRLSDRQGDIAEATPDLLPAQMASFEPFQGAEERYVRHVCEYPEETLV
ncbi:bifunctional aminoglycoside phosphotransferase/ATP-binding protein [Parathermosynechococcus lividus]